MAFAATGIIVPAGTIALLIGGGPGPNDDIGYSAINSHATATAFLGHPSYGLSPTVGYPFAPAGKIEGDAPKGDDLWVGVTATTTFWTLRNRVFG